MDYTHSAIVSPGPSAPARSASAPARVGTPATRVQAARLPIRGRYDAAQPTAENRRYAGMADALSARAANSLHVRSRLRNIARYEMANNSYAYGMIDTLANDLVGTGPRVQVMTADDSLNRHLADGFDLWAAEVGLAEKLRTLKKARVVTGEAFQVMAQNDRLKYTPIKLDLMEIEADQVTSPHLDTLDPMNADGIRFDDFGNPVSYRVEEHPGDLLQLRFGRGETFPADMVLHWFKRDRPGQVRGIPEITPALVLYGQLRRYTLAVLAAAETAADFAAVLESELPPEDGQMPEPMDALEIERRVMLTLPGGYKLHQFDARQPTTTYGDFKRELVNEIARCLNMPFNVAAGNSAGYNYASGRLDHQVYFKSLEIDRYFLETAILDRIFHRWLEWAYADGYIDGPAGRAIYDAPWTLKHQWFWDGWAHADPAKEANAQATRLGSGTTTLADEWAKQGFDWREKADQQAAERAHYARLGVPYPGDAAGPAPAPNAPPGDDDGEDAPGDD